MFMRSLSREMHTLRTQLTSPPLSPRDRERCRPGGVTAFLMIEFTQGISRVPGVAVSCVVSERVYTLATNSNVQGESGLTLCDLQGRLRR